jgi:hypothetical protein
MSMSDATVAPMDDKQVDILADSMMRHHSGNVGDAKLQDATTMRQTMFRRNTVYGGQSVAGELYFEILKDQRKTFNPATAHLTVLLQGAAYQLQF